MRQWAIAYSDVLSEGASMGFKLGDGDWPIQGFLVRIEGRCHAWLNSCPHAGHALNLKPDGFMTPEGDYIRCMSHGARFKADTGECVFGPCIGQSLRSLDCFEKHGRIFVNAPASILEF